ncbi:MAG: M56 family metallopeptidase [Lachnospiraceae bacterium]|nr:M56 family metallopeptidase [Lachnospiraceae bacterium]
MNWISEFFFCVGSMCITGSLATGLYMLMRGGMRKGKTGIELQTIKIVILMYLLPVAYLAVRMTRIGVSAEDLYSTGYFGVSTSPLFIKVFCVVGVIWLIGLVVGVHKRHGEERKLRAILALSIPINDPRWDEILKAECERYHLKGVEICQNELIISPMTVNVFRPRVVVPMGQFTDREKYIIIEHEVNHIRKHDVVWKRIAMLASWLHWFNPLNYMVLDWLSQEQEIECDLHVCTTTEHFTTKEYFSFMLSLIERSRNYLYSSGLSNSEDKLVRRIESVRDRKDRGKASKFMLLGISLILIAISVLPTYAMARKVAEAEEQWLADTEVMNLSAAAEENSASEPQVIQVVETVVENDEVDMSAAGSTYSSVVVVDIPGKANTRYNFKAQSMEVGDTVDISVRCVDTDVLFWIGIKNVNTNVAWYIPGNEILQHTFTVTEAGTYRAFVENRSDVDAAFVGSIIYPY